MFLLTHPAPPDLWHPEGSLLRQGGRGPPGAAGGAVGPEERPLPAHVPPVLPGAATFPGGLPQKPGARLPARPLRWLEPSSVPTLLAGLLTPSLALSSIQQILGEAHTVCRALFQAPGWDGAGT